METRRITLRLYPTKSQEKKLHYWRRMHKDLYNAALYNRKTQYQRFNTKVDYLEQQNSLPAFKQEHPEYKELGSHALQATLKRVDFAFNRFFKGLAKYPKFKSSRLYRGWTYPCIAGWKAHTSGDHGSLELSNLGNIRMRGRARTWGTPSTCTIVWNQGKWYASITVRCQPVRETSTGAIGLDFGCKTAVAMSDGTKIEKPRFLAQTSKKVKKASKRLRRKKAANRKKRVRASKRWKQAKKLVSKLHNKVANQRSGLAA